jgi:hypothetical protein
VDARQVAACRAWSEALAVAEATGQAPVQALAALALNGAR